MNTTVMTAGQTAVTADEILDEQEARETIQEQTRNAGTKPLGIYRKLAILQQCLKAPKNMYNSFGKYKYRNLEGILAGLKPLLKMGQMTLLMRDEIAQIGDRYYVKAIATLVDLETGETTETTAYARESETKSGMDAAQITGCASSYARKYCLNALLLIDDTQDPDTDAYQMQQRR